MTDHLERLRAALSPRYEVREEIGRGGMAIVFLAEDTKHRRKVALKVLRPDIAQAVGTDRFLSEIQITARLDHPHILPLLDSGKADGFLYFVMPYVEGETLRDRLERDTRLPVAEALRITRQIASALDYAHARGVVHRDLKPGNILLQSGHARLTDFGIAHAIGEAGGQRLTATGTSVGTPPYMSPEQAAGEKGVDARSDVYSLACVAFEMLAGQPPFTGASVRAVLAKHLSERPPPVTSIRPGAGAEVASALAKALEKAPEDRQPSAGAFAKSLEAGAASARFPVRAPWVTTAAGIAAVVLALWAGAWVITRLDGRGSSGASGAAPSAEIDPNVVAIFPLDVTAPDSSLDWFTTEIGSMLEYLFDGSTGPRAADGTVVRRKWDELTSSGAREASADELARAAAGLGYGQLLAGSAVGTASQVRVRARLERAVDRRILAQAEVLGSADPDSIWRVIDALGVQLAGLSAGEPSDRMRHLFGTSEKARRAYLAATRARRRGEYREAQLRYEEALHEDSTLALAALGLVMNMWWFQGEGSISWLEAMAMAWGNRDRLPPVDQLILEGRGGAVALDPTATSYAENVAAFRMAAALAPDRFEALLGLADTYLHHGAKVDVEAPTDLAWDLMIRAFESDTVWGSAHAELMNHLVDVAIARRDTAALHRFMPRYLAVASPGGRFAHALFAAHVGNDEEALDSLRNQLQADPRPPGMNIIIMEAPDLRAGYKEADYVDSVVEGDWAPKTRYAYALIRGRPRAAGKFAEVMNLPDREILLDGLYGGADEEAAAVAATRVSRTLSDTAAADGWLDRAENACNLSQWHLARRDFESARRTIGVLRRVELPTIRELGFEDVVGRELPTAEQEEAFRRVYPELCLPVVEAWLDASVQSSRARARLEAIDGRVREGPWADGQRMRRLNLALARAWELAGLPGRALAAVRRREAFIFIQPYLAESLRHEGRLAALVGDREGAAYAYAYYLELRSDPEPELLPEVEQVRAELASLR